MMDGEWGMLKDAYPASYSLFPKRKIYRAQNQAKVDEIDPFQFFIFLAIEHLEFQGIGPQRGHMFVKSANQVAT
jgi:hypothetical protein